jgi:hypothetical protein
MIDILAKSLPLPPKFSSFRCSECKKGPPSRKGVDLPIRCRAAF